MIVIDNIIFIFPIDENEKDDHHQHQHQHKQQQQDSVKNFASSTQIYTDKALAELIDYVLYTGDKNQDGFIDYAEYRQKNV